MEDIFARMRAAREEAPAPEETEAGQVAVEAEHRAPPEVASVVSEPGTVGEEHPAEAASPEEESESLLRRRDELVESIHHQVVRKLKRVVQDEQNDVLDRLRSYRGKPSVAVLLLSEEAQTARYADATRPLLEEAAAAGVRFGAEVQGRDAQVSDAAGVSDVARDLARAVGLAVRGRLERAAEQGADDEASMSDSVGAAYRDWKGKRADRVAGDHVAAAFALGVMAATPDGGLLRWMVDDGEGRCPDCDDNALGGPTAKGEVYPTGQLHPPAHPGCRCILVPSP
ncbi:MAG TPA: hypothetical protein VKI64_09340 [Acidimicrobiales bacterium]|nr:hypothetical protein [Acidimicrobiales bacterium]